MYYNIVCGKKKKKRKKKEKQIQIKKNSDRNISYSFELEVIKRFTFYIKLHCQYEIQQNKN